MAGPASYEYCTWSRKVVQAKIFKNSCDANLFIECAQDVRLQCTNIATTHNPQTALHPTPPHTPPARTHTHTLNKAASFVQSHFAVRLFAPLFLSCTILVVSAHMAQPFITLTPATQSIRTTTRPVVTHSSTPWISTLKDQNR